MKDLTGFSLLGIIVAVIVLILVAPWLYFWCSYFGGWIAKLVIGDKLVAALKLIGLTITKDQIPLLAGGLGWIGGFFKTIGTATKGN